MTKRIGLIGGMSWRTTELYYRDINQYVTSKLGGIHSAKLLINSLDYAEIANYIKTKDFDGLSQLLCRSGGELQSAGAEALVLCANIVHKVADDVVQKTGLPVLHIADFTAKVIIEQGHHKVGLLATRAVMEEEFYISRLKQKYGLEVFVPEPTFRQAVDSLIFDELSKEPICPDAVCSVRAAYDALVKDHNVDCIVLGCTEFRLVFGAENTTVPTYDTTKLHARGVAEWALRDG